MLSDIKIDLATGEPIIDDTTGDAVLIYEEDVVLQDIAIRLRTQRGQIKRQGLDDLGLGYMDFIKADMGPGTAERIASRMAEEAKKDDRVADANAQFIERTESEEVIFKVMVKLKSGAIRPLIIPIPG